MNIQFNLTSVNILMIKPGYECVKYSAAISQIKIENIFI